MSYYEDPYSSPEKHGLEVVGEIQWGPPCYDFNLTVVWRRAEDGAFLYGEDSGCSCPSPFESQSITDLTRIASLGEFQAHLNDRAQAYTENTDDVARLLETLHKQGLR